MCVCGANEMIFFNRASVHNAGEFFKNTRKNAGRCGQLNNEQHTSRHGKALASCGILCKCHGSWLSKSMRKSMVFASISGAMRLNN